MTDLIRTVSAVAMTVSYTASTMFSPTPVAMPENTPIEVQVQAPMEFTLTSEYDEPVIEVVEEPEPAFSYTDEEIYQLALITLAEAEGEPEYGQRLVIDTILNRVDSRSFANSIIGVIYEDGQFESTWNGRINQVRVTEEMLQLCREEMIQRTNYDVIFFRTGKYSKYGTPLFKVGHHYFSAE